jgi:hypothetical protein
MRTYGGFSGMEIHDDDWEQIKRKEIKMIWSWTYFFYVVGSICFLVGSIISWIKIKG